MNRRLLRLVRVRCLPLLFLAGLWLALGIGHFHPRLRAPQAIAQTSPTQLIQAGVDAYQQADYQSAIARWQEALAIAPDTADSDRALIFENLARTYQHIGQTEAAIDAWQSAAAVYQQADNPTKFGRMLTEQAQVYLSLGQYPRAIALLCGDQPQWDQGNGDAAPVQCAGGAYAIARTAEDTLGQLTALGSLAETYRLSGDHDAALQLLEAGLQLATTPDLARYKAALLNSQGNTHARIARIAARRLESAALLNVETVVADRLQQEASENQALATDSLRQAVQVAQAQNDLATELRSQLSLLSLYSSLDIADRGNAAALLPTASLAATRQRLGQLITTLPPSRATAYAAIALGKSYQTTARSFSCDGFSDDAAMQRWFEAGQDIALRIQDNRARSFALGELGHLEECRPNRLATAAELTQRARLAATEALESADSQYLWEWQMGRIYEQRGDTDKAIAAYRQAIATLENIRTDILTADEELQFDFRDTVEPIYREFIALQLTASAPVATKQAVAVEDPKVEEVLTTVDSLRLAELQNFFGDDCVLVASEGARQRLLAPGTAIMHSVVLTDETALILSLPDGTSKIARAGNTAALAAEVNEFRRGLKRFRNLAAYDTELANRLYTQIIGEFEADLTAAEIETLVFVQDGFLRNIPMAALYDGQQYLVQKYAIATTPALSLTAVAPGRPAEWRALAVGLSEQTITDSGQFFAPLAFVPKELSALAEQLPNSKILLDQAFTFENFKQAFQETPFNILHLATHGQFTTIPEETFVITATEQPGQSRRLTFGELETLIRTTSPNADPIDLLTLTACETATGDDRATLGLAGVAIRAGARSAIASLWKVEDASAAQLISQFYENLKEPTFSKAQALQAAQIAAIEAGNPGQNPGYWAPLILVGNWQ